MYSLMKLMSRRDLALQHLPVATSSLIVAEIFFKFGSFSLEAIAFLGTWFVIDALYSSARHLVQHANPVKSN